VHIKVSVQIENIFLKILTILEENLTLFSRIFQDLNCLSVSKKITNFAFHIGGASCVPMSIVSGKVVGHTLQWPVEAGKVRKSNKGS